MYISWGIFSDVDGVCGIDSLTVSKINALLVLDFSWDLCIRPVELQWN